MITAQSKRHRDPSNLGTDKRDDNRRVRLTGEPIPALGQRAPDARHVVHALQLGRNSGLANEREWSADR